MRSIPIPPSKVGLVIGSKGRNLKRMAQIQGVTSLRISTSGDGCKSLVVIGTAKAFAEVEREVQELTRKRGPSKMHNGYSFQGPYMTLFIGTHRTVFCFGAVNGLSEEKQRVVTSYETSETDALEYELHHLSLDSASSDSKGLMAPSNYGLLTESLQHVLASCRSLAYNLKTYWELTVGITLIEPDSPQVLGSRICHQHSKGFQAESPDLTYFEDVLTDLGYEFLTRKRKTTLHFRDRSTNNNVKVSVRGTETLEDEGEAASLIRK
ncbi:MAG: hypothetical protein KVP17_005242, partial [Porospora cf. gigantea B]|uniref:uncharacterized protein n=1 Tax=Porospora cf. gigantea B TaxID=2853592 RepID=UPI003571D728